MSKEYYSCAEWPEGIPGLVNTTTKVKEPSESNAEVVCTLLKKQGFGGKGKVFPVEAWVETREAV